MSLCRDTDCIQKTHYAVAHAYVKNFLESSRYVFALVFHGQSSPIYIGGATPYESCVKFPHDRLHHIDVNFGTMYEYEIFKLHARTLREAGIEYALWERMPSGKWARTDTNVTRVKKFFN